MIEGIKAEAKLEGLAEGMAHGREEGMARGREEGKLEGLAAAVVEIIVGRGVSLAALDRTRILAERDPDRLARWIARAATCATAADLFAMP